MRRTRQCDKLPAAGGAGGGSRVEADGAHWRAFNAERAAGATARGPAI
jgi:hypothetical protein